MTDGVDRIYEFVENAREAADEVETRCQSGDYFNEDYANGVCVGLRWAAHDLESVLDDEFADTEAAQDGGSDE